MQILVDEADHGDDIIEAETQKALERAIKARDEAGDQVEREKAKHLSTVIWCDWRLLIFIDVSDDANCISAILRRSLVSGSLCYILLEILDWRLRNIDSVIGI